MSIRGSCWQCGRGVSLAGGGVMEASPLPCAGSDKSRHVQGPCRHRPARQPEEKGRSRFRDGVAYRRLCRLSPVSTLGWRLPQVISWIAESITGTSWRNSSVYLVFYMLGSSRKGKLGQYIRCVTCYCLGTLVSVII